jgi:hypothetical protein
VFKNGVLLTKAKFKEVADGKLVFMADGKSMSVPADQFPGELSVLGEDVVKLLAEELPKNSPSQEQITNPENSSMPSVAAGSKETVIGQLNNGNSFLQKAEQVKEISKKGIAELETKIISLTEEAKKSEAAFDAAGGEKLLNEVHRRAGRYCEILVLKALVDPSFKALGGRDENVYEVKFLEDDRVAILVTELKLASGRRGGLNLKFRETIEVSLVNGGKDNREVYDETLPADTENPPEIVKLHSVWQARLEKVKEAAISLGRLRECTEQKVACLTYASKRIANIHVAQMTVSPLTGKEGYSVSVQDRRLRDIASALKEGSLVKLSASVDKQNMTNAKLEAIEDSLGDDIKLIATIDEIKLLFDTLEEQQFRVEFFTSNGRAASTMNSYQYQYGYVTVPKSLISNLNTEPDIGSKGSTGDSRSFHSSGSEVS